MHIWRNGGIKFSELQINDSSHNEGTTCLVNKCIGAEWMVFKHECSTNSRMVITFIEKIATRTFSSTV